MLIFLKFAFSSFWVYKNLLSELELGLIVSNIRILKTRAILLAVSLGREDFN